MTSDPKGLLAQFEARINQEERENRIETWAKTADGAGYTHLGPQYKDDAYFIPDVEQKDRLLFRIQPRKDQKLTPEIYGYYHGHLMAAFLTHFRDVFTEGRCSPPQVAAKPAAPNT
jgi:hypothetical protein